jgi:hypothetical protein
VRRQLATLQQAVGGTSPPGPAYRSASAGAYSLLQYNPPYTLPWLRRNEIAIALEADEPAAVDEPAAADEPAAVADAAVEGAAVVGEAVASSNDASEESAPSDVDGEELVGLAGEAAAAEEGGGAEGDDDAEPPAEPSEEDWMDAPSD